MLRSHIPRNLRRIFSWLTPVGSSGENTVFSSGLDALVQSSVINPENKMYFTKPLLTFVAVIVTVSAYPTGAPDAVCETMIPGHGPKPQNTPFPYDIVIEKQDLKAGESTKVTIIGKDGHQFRGYMMQARDGKKPIGQFTVPDSESHTIDCGTGKANTVTQSNPRDKKEITVTWTAPKDFKGKVVFYVTIVKVFEVYWVAQPSSAVKIS